MRADLVALGRSLTGTSDLTLLAPLKKGLVPSLESMTYATRLRKLLRMLNGGRGASHEFAFVRPISDSVERVARIHSVRVALFEPEQLVLLAVTFDGTFDGYIRVLWQKVGALLDLIFCNTVDYTLSTGRFDDWAKWVRGVQRETGFFFSTHGLTVGDARYLREHERLQRDGSSPGLGALAGTRLATPTAEALAARAGAGNGGLEMLRQGLQSLALLYRIADLYMPGTDDGAVLLRAARELLLEFRTAVEAGLPPAVEGPMRQRFGRQLDWLLGRNGQALPAPRVLPPLPERPEPPDWSDVQGGMLAGYTQPGHGCLVLIGFDSAKAGHEFLTALRPRLQTSVGATGRLFDPASYAEPAHPGPGPFFNLALTLEGLRRLGWSEADLQSDFPREFVEGMEERAGLLGDHRANHPRRWRLPRANWPGSGGRGQPVALATVHALVQIRWFIEDVVPADATDKAHPLHAKIASLLLDAQGAPLTGVRVLHVQTMQRNFNAAGEVVEHFGFADGRGQPQFTAPTPAGYPNQVPLGEVLLGHPNSVDPFPGNGEEVLRNGSFMVVRKLRQNVAPLRRAVRRAAAETGLPAELLLAKMMGRWRSGASLIAHPQAEPPPGTPVDTGFTFEADADGRACPFHAHVRRVNPRTVREGIGEPPGRRAARLLRRGMSYGPPASLRPGDAGDDGRPRPDDDDERGLMFIAYNASLAEQFEVVQGWISGGNSSGGLSAQNDPFLGVPEPGEQRHIRFEVEGPGREPRVVTVALDRGPAAFGEPEPFVRLEWGLYLFVPAMHALRLLARRTADGKGQWDENKGRARIAAIEAAGGDIDAWKAAIEDPDEPERLAAASLWAAVRKDGGVRRAGAYGVLVGSAQHVAEVLGDDTRFSVSGYHAKMADCGFEIYLGLDKGAAYDALATEVNKALMKLTAEEAFTITRNGAMDTLDKLVAFEKVFAAQVQARRWELNFDAKELIDRALAALCLQWFGLPRQGGPLAFGSWRWDWKPGDPPVCPVHFTPPSRHFFQPHSSQEVADNGERYAKALAEALTAWVGTLPAALPPPPAGKLTTAVLDALPGEPPEVLGRTLAGVMMGFLPTLDGNLRLVLNEWTRTQRLWALRHDWAADAAAPDLVKARRVLEASMRLAMQCRPSPDIVWRTVAQDGVTLGGVPLDKGDTVVLGLASAMHEHLGNGDVYAAFGGNRKDASGTHPTHACPGYDAAIGALLGVLSVFAEMGETLRPSPAPLAFTLEGPMP